MTLELPGGAEPEPSAAGRLLGGAGRLAGWAARTGVSAARQVPGVKAAERGLQEIERAALSELRKRMNSTQADDTMLLPYAQASTPGVPVVTTHGDFNPLRATMAELLQRSLQESSAQAREDLYASTLNRLTPDEARIVSALSDGTPFALIDVAERVGVNGVGRYLVRNACSVGKAAGLTLSDQVQVYVARLRTLDLAVVGDESPDLHEDYEILLTEQSIRTAIESVRRTKVIRRTLRISPFGADFWSAVDPTGWR